MATTTTHFSGTHYSAHVTAHLTPSLKTLGFSHKTKKFESFLAYSTEKSADRSSIKICPFEMKNLSTPNEKVFTTLEQLGALLFFLLKLLSIRPFSYPKWAGSIRPPEKISALPSNVVSSE